MLNLSLKNHLNLFFLNNLLLFVEEGKKNFNFVKQGTLNSNSFINIEKWINSIWGTTNDELAWYICIWSRKTRFKNTKRIFLLLFIFVYTITMTADSLDCWMSSNRVNQLSLCADTTLTGLVWNQFQTNNFFTYLIN